MGTWSAMCARHACVCVRASACARALAANFGGRCCCKCRRLLPPSPAQFQLAVDEVEGVAEELDPWRHDTSVPLVIEVRVFLFFWRASHANTLCGGEVAQLLFHAPRERDGWLG